MFMGFFVHLARQTNEIIFLIQFNFDVWRKTYLNPLTQSFTIKKAL